MIIGISGKIGSGKDTIADIIKYRTSLNTHLTFEEWRKDYNYDNPNGWEIHKFADALKDNVCRILGCTREQLEDQDFKNKELGEEWTRYGYADGFDIQYRNGRERRIMNVVPCDRERYELELKINWQTAYKSVLTPRLILQLLGTEGGRNLIHPNIWVNATMANYKNNLSNWIITDVRFPNEAQAILDKKGLLLRVERQFRTSKDGNLETPVHSSETALDDYDGFHYTIDNNGTIEELIDKINNILIIEKIENADRF